MNFNWMEEEGGPQERLGVDHLVESLLGWAFQQVTCPSHCNDPQDQNCIVENKDLKRDYDENFHWNDSIAREDQRHLCDRFPCLKIVCHGKYILSMNLRKKKNRRRSRSTSKEIADLEGNNQELDEA